MSLITLLTDFGSADHYVAAMKGVILSISRHALIVDLTHEIPAHDIEAGAFTLLVTVPTFPAATIHVAVVDPGVGSERRPLLIEASGQFFIGPDNGLFSYVCEKFGLKRAIVLTNEKYFRQPISRTFNGRDIFAPVAAALSNGAKPGDFGSETDDVVRLESLNPKTSTRGKMTGRIIHIDRFGNCITNFTSNHLTPAHIGAGASLKLKGKSISSFKNYFAEPIKPREKVFAVWGSSGFLEVAAENQSAAKLLKVKRGDAVLVNLK